MDTTVKQRSGRKPTSARALAGQALYRVTGPALERSPDVLRRLLNQQVNMDPRERGLTTELVYGVLRWQRLLDAALTPWVHQGLDAIEPHARILLRIGAYQILRLDRIPGPIAVSATQDAARELGLGRMTGFINGVLRRVVEHGFTPPEGDSDEAIGVRTSLPDWIVASLKEAYGPERAEAEGLAMRQRGGNTVRPTLSRGGAEAVTAALATEGFTCEPAPYGTLTISGPGDPFATNAFEDGLFIPQDPASVAIIDFMGPVDGLNVADLCAGRGVKATALADRGAYVFATDIGASKLRGLTRLAEKLGLSDAIVTRPQDITTNKPTDIGTFPRVLVDAPCTGLGTLRKHPEIAWRKQPQDAENLAEVQRKILWKAAEYVAPEGELVYVVCTFTRVEGYPPLPSGFEEVERLTLAPTEGVDAFQAIRLRRS